MAKDMAAQVATVKTAGQINTNLEQAPQHCTKITTLIPQLYWFLPSLWHLLGGMQNCNAQFWFISNAHTKEGVMVQSEEFLAIYCILSQLIVYMNSSVFKK